MVLGKCTACQRTIVVDDNGICADCNTAQMKMDIDNDMITLARVWFEKKYKKKVTNELDDDSRWLAVLGFATFLSKVLGGNVQLPEDGGPNGSGPNGSGPRNGSGNFAY